MSKEISDIAGGRPFESEQLNYAWRQYCGDKTDNSANTLQANRRQMGVFEDWLQDEGIEVTEADHNDLVNYLTYLQFNGGEDGNGLSPKTVQDYWQAVNIAYKYLSLDDRIELNPTDKVRERGTDVLSADVEKKRQSEENERINPLSREEVSKHLRRVNYIIGRWKLPRWADPEVVDPQLGHHVDGFELSQLEGNGDGEDVFSIEVKTEPDGWIPTITCELCEREIIGTDASEIDHTGDCPLNGDRNE